MESNCLGIHPSSYCTYSETANQKKSLNNYLSNANSQVARIQKFMNLHAAIINVQDVGTKIFGTGTKQDCTKDSDGITVPVYKCNTCSGTQSLDHQSFMCQGVFYIQIVGSNCNTYNTFQLNCENVIFARTEDTSGESAYDMMQKFVGWYYSLSKPTGGASWNVTNTRPTHQGTFNFIELNHIVRPHLTVANVLIKVDTGNQNGCYKTPTYTPLKPCPSSPVNNILNSSLYATYGGTNYFEDFEDYDGSYAPSAPLQDLSCSMCNYANWY